MKGGENMKKLFAVTAMIAGLVVLGTGVFADTPVINRREVRQEKRIQSGVDKGLLTTKETMHLEKQQGHIQTMEVKAKSDGVVTGKERVKITRAQNKANRDIRRLKHNNRTK